MIPAQPNRDWRDVARRKQNVFVPAHERDEAGASAPEVLGQSMAIYGLQLTQRSQQPQSEETETTVTTNDANGTTTGTAATPVKLENEMEVDPDKALERRALEALMSGMCNFLLTVLKITPVVCAQFL